nr:UDP-glycosyltransferase 79B6 [Ipomoea batatas]
MLGKRVYCTGPLLPEQPREEPFDDEIARWLGKFEQNSVIFCVFGSEVTLAKEQFQELVLGLELTGLPFLVAVKPPEGLSSIEEALPEGFQERVKGKGIVHGGWVPQPMILRHKAVGYFVNHGGSASMWESLASHCRIILAPANRFDFILNARLMAEELKAAVEVERDENGKFFKENLCNAIKSVMGENVIGRIVEVYSPMEKVIGGKQTRLMDFVLEDVSSFDATQLFFTHTSKEFVNFKNRGDYTPLRCIESASRLAVGFPINGGVHVIPNEIAALREMSMLFQIVMKKEQVDNYYSAFTVLRICRDEDGVVSDDDGSRGLDAMYKEMEKDKIVDLGDSDGASSSEQAMLPLKRCLIDEFDCVGGTSIIDDFDCVGGTSKKAKEIVVKLEKM